MTKITKINNACKFGSDLNINSPWDKVTVENISKKTDMSKKRVYQLFKIIDKNKLGEFKTAVDFHGLRAFTAILFLKSKHPMYDDLINKKLESFDYTHTVYPLAGGGALGATHIIRVRAPSFRALKEFNKKLAEEIGEIMSWSQTMIVRNFCKDEYVKYKADTPKVKIDKIDYYILEILKKDSRTSLNQIASKLKLTAPTIYKRIKNMQKKKVIKGCFFVRNLKNIPPDSWPVTAICALRLGLVDVDHAHDLANIPLKDANISFVYTVFGRYDIIFDLRTNTIAQLKKIISDITNKLPVKEVSTFITAGYIYNNLPMDKYFRD